MKCKSEVGGETVLLKTRTLITYYKWDPTSSFPDQLPESWHPCLILPGRRLKNTCMDIWRQPGQRPPVSCFPSVNTMRSTERSRLSSRHIEFIVSWFLSCTQMWVSRGGHLLVWKMIKKIAERSPKEQKKKKKKEKLLGKHDKLSINVF